MVLKRPYGNEDTYDLPWKQPRQFECSNQLPSFVKIVSRIDVAQKSHIPVYESEGGLNRCQYGDRSSETVAAVNELETTAPSISGFSWANNRTSEEDLKSEAAVRFSYFPGIFEHDYSTRPHTENEDMYSPVFDCLPRKLVSVGPDHQANVPIWGLPSRKNDCGSVEMAVPSIAPTDSLNSRYFDDVDSKMMMGTCVIPMPDSGAFDFGRDKVGKGRTDCCCQDKGSMRCVGQHIMESREKLKGTIGQEAFLELGFYNMGEVVTKKWSEKEEQDFNEVVFSNPASLGKNFWDHLSVVFPSRTKKEIVSYYFNVFVLRRRGEQNRLDPLNIDSDDDEWQCSEDGDDELRTTEEDEDSVVESLEEEDYPLSRKHFDENVESGDDESCDNNVWKDGGAARVEDNGKLDYVSEACNGRSPGDCRSGRAYPQNCEDDQDLQDDSCTSYECHISRADSSYPAPAASKQECRVESDHSKHFQNNYNGLSGMSNLGYDMEPCDARIWDVEFLSSCRTDVDLLSTCNMIEEVFGDETWNDKGRDGKGMS